MELNETPAEVPPARRILRLARLRPHLPVLAPILLCILIESLYYAGLPFSFQYVIDVGLLGNDRRALVLLIAGLAGGAVLVALLGFARVMARRHDEVTGPAHQQDAYGGQ